MIWGWWGSIARSQRKIGKIARIGYLHLILVSSQEKIDNNDKKFGPCI
jgi:hypothetical protein